MEVNRLFVLYIVNRSVKLQLPLPHLSYQDMIINKIIEPLSHDIEDQGNMYWVPCLILQYIMKITLVCILLMTAAVPSHLSAMILLKISTIHFR